MNGTAEKDDPGTRLNSLADLPENQNTKEEQEMADSYRANQGKLSNRKDISHKAHLTPIQERPSMQSESNVKMGLIQSNES